MGLVEKFKHEKVRIKKANGELVKEEAKAIFSKNTVKMNADVNIEKNYIIERMLPNGHCERYQILDTGFFNGCGKFIDHYKAKVKKIINE